MSDEFPVKYRVKLAVCWPNGSWTARFVEVAIDEEHNPNDAAFIGEMAEEEFYRQWPRTGNDSPVAVGLMSYSFLSDEPAAADVDEVMSRYLPYVHQFGLAEVLNMKTGDQSLNDMLTDRAWRYFSVEINNEVDHRIIDDLAGDRVITEIDVIQSHDDYEMIVQVRIYDSYAENADPRVERLNALLDQIPARWVVLCRPTEELPYVSFGMVLSDNGVLPPSDVKETWGKLQCLRWPLDVAGVSLGTMCQTLGCSENYLMGFMDSLNGEDSRPDLPSDFFLDDKEYRSGHLAASKWKEKDEPTHLERFVALK